MKAFDFATAAHAERYARDGYAHIPAGVTAPFVDYACAFQQRQRQDLPEFAFAGKKQQFLFEFPDEACLDGIKDVVAQVTGLCRRRLTLCERHIKAYSTVAAADPPPHKDRVASEVAVGIPLVMKPASQVVLYPKLELTVNPFNSAALWRDSLDEAQLPERILKGKPHTLVHTAVGDVLLFRGSAIYHERRQAAGTVVLYLKFNAMCLDPLGEDPTTVRQRKQSLAWLNGCDEDQELMRFVVEPSPRLHRISRHYTRLGWQQLVQAYVADAKPFRLSEQDLHAIQLADGSRKLGDVWDELAVPRPELTQTAAAFRRLIQLQALDLVKQ